MEKFLSLLKKVDTISRDRLLCNFDLSSNTESLDLPPTSSDNDNNHLKDKFISFSKPPIYTSSKLRNIKQKTKKKTFTPFHHHTTVKYITNFFKWKYMENNLYIYRESFLTDFFREENGPNNSLEYCTEDLIYAICAIGSIIDFGDDYFMYQGILFDTPEKFYYQAKYLIFQKLNSNSYNEITSIQTLLCLSYFDLGRGNDLSAWTLAGIAFRIGTFDNFELDPRLTVGNNILNTHLTLTEYEANVKTRIYWGCVIADSYISFVLGKSPTLRHLRATMPHCKNLPFLKGIESFLYFDPVAKTPIIVNISRPLEKLNVLYQLANRYHDLVYRDSSSNNGLSTLYYLEKFNVDIFHWKDSLPRDLYWTKNELKSNGYNINLMFFRYQYYLILLSFNRDFIDADNSLDETVSPALICTSAIEDLYTSIQCFSKFHSLKYASLNMVYLAILGIQIVPKLPENIALTVQKKSLINIFGSVLAEGASVYEIAKDAYEAYLANFKDLGLKHNIGSRSPDTDRSKHSLNHILAPVSFRDVQETVGFDESLIPSLNYG